MKFAQSSFVYSNYSLQYAIRSMGRMGYDGIAVWGGRPHMYRQDLHAQLPRDPRPAGRVRHGGVPRRPGAVPLPVAAGFHQREGAPGQRALHHGQRGQRAAARRAVAARLRGYEPVRRAAGAGLGLPAPEHRARSWSTCAGTGLRLYIEPAHRFESNQILTLDDGLRMIARDRRSAARHPARHRPSARQRRGPRRGRGEAGAAAGARGSGRQRRVRPIRTWRPARARSTLRRSPPRSNAPATRAMCRPSWACSTCSTPSPSSPSCLAWMRQAFAEA